MAIAKYPENVEIWESSGQAKIVVSVNSENELMDLCEKAKNKNLPSYLVRDAGRTQVASGTATVCAVGPGSKILVDSITGHLNLL
jgi:PTH2 family peptidyl-tRNA hydrolase